MRSPIRAVVPRPDTAVADTPTDISTVVLAVPARSDEVAGIRRAIGALGRRAGLDEDRMADVALAVGEACANAVVHAYTDREPGTLRVTAELDAHGLHVVVADDGRGMTPRPDSPGLGLGLPLIASLTTAMEFHAAPGGGTEIRMVFATRGPAASAGWARTG